MYSQGGWSYLTPNPKLYYEGELAILQTQLALEDSFMRMAETCTKPTFVVCDRGTMDISAYISPEMWQDITAKCGTCTNQLRERYDAVLHLVSADHTPAVRKNVYFCPWLCLFMFGDCKDNQKG